MKLSVIVPAYNIENYIGRCLISLINQTEKDIEIIVVDDGSTDRTAEIIDEIDDFYPGHLKIVHKENGGAANARNVALTMAHGDYIGFVDGDDYLDLTMYERMLKKAKEDNADIVTCGYYRIRDGHFYAKQTEAKDCFPSKALQDSSLFLNNVPFLWNKIFKRELIDRAGAYFYNDLRIYEDLVFTYTMILHARCVSQVPEPFYNYVNRGGSLTDKFTEKRFDLFKAFDHLIGEFRKADSFYHFEKELQYIYEEHMYVVFKQGIKAGNLHLKHKFINDAFKYGVDNFSEFLDNDIYFKTKGKNMDLYRNKEYWYARTFLPDVVKRGLVEGRQFVREKHFTFSGQYFYDFYYRFDVNKKRIFMVSQQGQNPCGNIFYILKALCNDHDFDDYEIVIGVAKNKELSLREFLGHYGLNSRIRIAVLYTNDHAMMMATSKYLITDTSFSNWYVKKKDQVVINTWHGTPLKTLGRATTHDYYDIANVQRNFLFSDYLLYPNEFMKEQMLRDYMLDGIYEGTVVEYGYPRNEIFFERDNIERVRREYKFDNKKAYAYMPTYRGNVRSVNKSQEEEISEYLSRMDAMLSDDEVMFVNLHPYLENKIDYSKYSYIKPFPKRIETYEFLNACDALITDYSSVFFDYACTRKPIYLFAYDEKEYFAERGVYIELDELPFMRLGTPEELITAIHEEKGRMSVGYNAFVEKFCPHDCAKAADKLMRHIILGEENSDILEEKTIKKDYLENRAVLVFSENFDSLLDNKELFKIEDIRDAVHEPDAILYLFYETSELHSNKSYIKKMPKELRFFGSRGGYSFVPFITEVKLHSWKKRYKYTVADVENIFKANERALMFEARRTFGGFTFDRVAKIGRVSLYDELRIKALRKLHKMNN